VEEIVKTLPPGRELDALIAERVMRLKRGALGEGTVESPAVEVWGEGILLPHYSTRIEDAWLVVETIDRPTGLTFALIDNDKHWIAIWGRWSGGLFNPIIECYADTAPHAICLAALKAVGHE
jgi:hypothetical protein